MKNTDVKNLIEKISKKMSFSKKIVDIEFNEQRLHYSIRFNDHSGCVIPKSHIDNYLRNPSRYEYEEEIMNCLSISEKSF